MVFIIIVVVVAVVGISLAAMFNSLVRLNQQSDEAFSDITVQLKRRYDLIPNLVNTVKGYAAHESSVFENVTAARANALNAQGVAETAKADNAFTQTMKSLFAVAENYPDLKTTKSFQDFQTQIEGTENRINVARRDYNGSVNTYNQKVRLFPNNIFAGILGYHVKGYYKADAGAEKNPDIHFNIK